MLKSVEQLFDLFLAAKCQEDVLKLFNDIKIKITEQTSYTSSSSIDLYYTLKKNINSWRAQSIWKILDERVQDKVYQGNQICKGKRFLIIGAGPIGLRMAVECAFLGAETHVLEKRTSATRNNILHLWPFTIDDLRRLGAKKVYGQFCAGAIDHISIRQLQLILLKVCCLLGVNVHVGVEFVGVEEPVLDKKGECSGWGLNVSPHPPDLPKWKWEVIVQATGRQHILPLFQYKECRGQQAIGMTVNFVNRGTMEELTIEEISGIAFIYNQEFFNDMYVELGIALENIVYYKDETHYFVMSAKKHSLISKQVLKKDYPTTSELLSPDNIDYVKAQQFAREVAGFATNLPVLDFMTNHHGKADVAVFDFSAIKIAANSAMVVERKGEKLLMCLVGDSLLEPFWPQGTGCARGFLSVLNSAWMFKKYYQGVQVYEVLRERESLFKLLAQSSPMKLNNKHDKYTIDPSTRYNYWTVSTEQFEVFHLYNKGDTPILNNHPRAAEKPEIKGKRRSRQDRRKTVQVTLNRSQPKRPDVQLPPTPTLEQGLLLNWARESTCGYPGVRVSNLTTTWKSGLAFSALIHRYRPDILNFTSVSKYRPEQLLRTVFNVTLKELGVVCPLSAKELATASIPDRQKIVAYLTALYTHFNSEESKSLQISPDMCYFCSRHITPDQLTSSHNIKFHASCLKCEHCLDKISANTLHFVNTKIAEEFAKRRKPGFQFLKSGFYCKFHFKEFFTATSSSLYPEDWLGDKETEFISEISEINPTIDPCKDPLTTTHHSDTEEGICEPLTELRRAKSVASVRNLRELFENISTGQVEVEQAPQIVPNNLYDKLMNIHSNLTSMPKSKSFSGTPPLSRPRDVTMTTRAVTMTTRDVTPLSRPLDSEVLENNAASCNPQKRQKANSEMDKSPATQHCGSPDPPPSIPANLNNLKYDEASRNNSKKRKSGIAKRIEKRRESVTKMVESGTPKRTNRASSAVGDLQGISLDTAGHLSSDTSDNKPITDQKPLLTDTQTTNKKKNKFKFFKKKVSRTTSLVLENAEESSSLVISNASDPLYTIPKPHFLESSPDGDELNSSFDRNSFSRRTAPPKLRSPEHPKSPDTEHLVDSKMCRSKAVQNVSREAVVLQTNSPQARSLLRSSVRNSKRGLQPFKLGNSPTTPKTSRVQIAQPQQVFLSPPVGALVSKTICSPKPKRAQKVKVDNVEVVREPQPQTTSQCGIVLQTFSPKPQRSKKIRLSRASPRELSSLSSSSDSPPERPAPPAAVDLDMSLATSHLARLEYKTQATVPSSAPQSTTSLTSTSSSGTFTTSMTDMTSSLDSPGQVRGAQQPSSVTSTAHTAPDTHDSVFKEKRMPYLLKYEEEKQASLASSSLLESSLSSSDMSEIRSDSLTPLARAPKPFMYAKRSPVDAQLRRSAATPSPEPSSYHTPGSHGSTPASKTTPIDETFYTPEKEDSDSRKWRMSDPPAFVTRMSNPPASVTRMSDPPASVIRMSDPPASVTRMSDPPAYVARMSDPPVTRIEPTKERRTEGVLEREMSPAEHSSINTILQKYRKLPTESDCPSTPTSSKLRHPKPLTSVSERRANYDRTPDARPSLRELPDKRRIPQNRVKMITQLSASFDKTIDKLVNKYHPARRAEEGEVARSSPTCTREETKEAPRKRISSVRKQTSKDSPSRAKTPSGSGPESPTKTVSRGSTPTKPLSRGSTPGERKPLSDKRRTDSLRSSTRSRDIIPVDHALLRYDRNSSFKDQNSEFSKRPTTPTSRSTTPISRVMSARDVPVATHHGTARDVPVATHHGTARHPRTVERQPSTPTRLAQTNVDKFRYTGQTGRIDGQQNLPPTATGGETTQRSDRENQAERPTDNIPYIEAGEGKPRDKRDYNKYLKSLYYQYSSPQNVSDKVESTIKAFQRKQTDV